jgi:hypothetical protein
MIASLWLSAWLAFGLMPSAVGPAAALDMTGDPPVYQLTVSGMT